MHSWLGALAQILLAACGGSQPTGNADFGSVSSDNGTISLRREMAFVVPPNRLVPADELAAAVRKAGYPCGAVTAFGQLELDGRALDNYKLDCGERAYLVTWLDGNSRIKLWSDGILELSPHVRRSPHSPRLRSQSVLHQQGALLTN